MTNCRKINWSLAVMMSFTAAAITLCCYKQNMKNITLSSCNLCTLAHLYDGKGVFVFFNEISVDTQFSHHKCHNSWIFPFAYIRHKTRGWRTEEKKREQNKRERNRREEVRSWGSGSFPDWNQMRNWGWEGGDERSGKSTINQLAFPNSHVSTYQRSFTWQHY